MYVCHLPTRKYTGKCVLDQSTIHKNNISTVNENTISCSEIGDGMIWFLTDEPTDVDS